MVSFHLTVPFCRAQIKLEQMYLIKVDKNRKSLAKWQRKRTKEWWPVDSSCSIHSPGLGFGSIQKGKKNVEHVYNMENPTFEFPSGLLR